MFLVCTPVIPIAIGLLLFMDTVGMILTNGDLCGCISTPIFSGLLFTLSGGDIITFPDGGIPLPSLPPRCVPCTVGLTISDCERTGWASRGRGGGMRYVGAFCTGNHSGFSWNAAVSGAVKVDYLTEIQAKIYQD
jgi:hypothetical protein